MKTQTKKAPKTATLIPQIRDLVQAHEGTVTVDTWTSEYGTPHPRVSVTLDKASDPDDRATFHLHEALLAMIQAEAHLRYATSSRPDFWRPVNHGYQNAGRGRVIGTLVYEPNGGTESEHDRMAEVLGRMAREINLTRWNS